VPECGPSETGRVEGYDAVVNPLWYFLIGFLALCVVSLLLGLMSADSRPGFLNGRFDVKERWFFHSKRD
jgi:hypothetical protein